MGKININFHVSNVLANVAHGIIPNAIPGRDLAMVLLNLPGATHITGCATGITTTGLMTENTIEATNDKLPDGTNVTCKYVREVTMIGGALQQFDRYDGMHIEQPQGMSPYKQQPPAHLPMGFNNAATVPVVVSLGPCFSSHDWKTYQGLSDSYEYCKTCGIKK